MSTEQNKRIIARAFDGLDRADRTAFVDSMATTHYVAVKSAPEHVNR